LKKDIKRYIECELRNYMQSKRDIKEIRETIIESTPSNDRERVREGGGVSDLVASKGMKLLTNKRLKRLEETCKSIESVYNELPEEKKKLILLKYWTRPQELTDTGICKKLNIGKSTFYRWRDYILLSVAFEMGLVDEYDIKKLIK